MSGRTGAGAGSGARIVAGVDEAGRGPLAGPVVAAAVILDPAVRIEGLADSKRLSAGRRVDLDREIRERALSFAVARVGAAVIDARADPETVTRRLIRTISERLT